MTGLKVKLDMDGNIAIVSLVGEARVENVAQVESAIADGLQASAQDVLLNVIGLTFMDSASAGVLLRSNQQIEALGGRIVIYGVRRMISRMFDAAGLGSCFAVVPNESAARALLAGNAGDEPIS